MMFGYNDNEINEFLISFYKSQYLKFMKIGAGGLTEHNTLVTYILIKTTANRLDQLIKGKVTDENRCNGLNLTYRKPLKYDSNRSFGWNYSSSSIYSGLDFKQRYSIDYPIIIIETYIDKYTTAYRTLEDYNDRNHT